MPTDDRRAGGATSWQWIVAAILLFAGGGFWAARRRSAVAKEAAVPEALPIVAPVPAAGPRLTLAFRPARVGFNMLSATVEGELTITNEGTAAEHDARVRTVLLSAHAGQDADLDAFVAEPIGRPVVPPFALAAGEGRTIRVVAAAPRDGLRTMAAAGRPMFVPVLAVNVVASGGQVAQAFAVGIDRVDSAKLAPFWLDLPPRSYDQVAARPQGAPVTR